MRKSFHTLCGLVRNKIGGDPMNGDVYIFVNKRRNRIKLLHHVSMTDLSTLAPELGKMIKKAIMENSNRK